MRVGEERNGNHLLHYSFKLARPVVEACTVTRFTVKFRHGEGAGWKWVNEQFNWSDGVIFWQPARIEAKSISDYIEGLDSAIEAAVEVSETPDTLLWSLSCPIDAASGTTPAYSQLNLGKVVKSSRWFATSRLYTPWFIPRHGKGQFVVDKEAVEVGFLRKDGLSVVVLALSGINDTSVCLVNDDGGNVVINSQNDSDAASHSKILVAVAKSYDIANASVLYHARKVSTDSSSELVAEIRNIPVEPKSDLQPNWYEEWVDGFGFCTWNSLGQDLTEQKILDALESFRKDGIKLTTLIVDDNWQSLDKEGEGQGSRGMTEFDADKKYFPDGLKSAVAKIKSQNPSINRIAVWHTMVSTTLDYALVSDQSSWDIGVLYLPQERLPKTTKLSKP